jgi:STAS-like domain of unknown function (DUF4325)
MTTTTMPRIEINVASQFSRTPGPRKRSEGDFSGEQFLEDLLLPKFLEARKAGCTLHVDLDGAVGYPTSFLEEAFGGLARKCGIDVVQSGVVVTCSDAPYILGRVERYIRDANKIR